MARVTPKQVVAYLLDDRIAFNADLVSVKTLPYTVS